MSTLTMSLLAVAHMIPKVPEYWVGKSMVSILGIVNDGVGNILRIWILGPLNNTVGAPIPKLAD